MSQIVPLSRPQQSREQTLAVLREHGITDSFGLLGVRGYYLDGMGKRGANDRGIYDDAIFLITPAVYLTFNANCDPSVFRPGEATLKPGVWKYQLGIHGLSKPKDKQYEALVQAAAVTVVRDGGKEDTGFFGLNIHKGGYGTTGSAGCQTLYPDEWDEFIAKVKAELVAYARAWLPYVLTEKHANNSTVEQAA